MGYLVEWHIPKHKFDFDVLNRLPSGLAVSVFRIDGCDLDLVYADFAARKFFPQQFDDKYDKLNSLYETLVEMGLYVSPYSQVVNLNLWLSQALKDEVISVVSNDDQLDLAVQSRSGSLSRLRFRTDEIEVLYENDDVQIIPFFPELSEPEVNLKNFDNRDFIIQPREKVMSSELHEIAAEEVVSFLGIKPQLIGLATWEFDEERLNRVFTREVTETAAPENRAKEVVFQQEKKLSLKTRFIVLMLAALSVLGMLGYSEYKDAGHIDSSWYIATGATIALVLIVFGVFAKRK